MFSNHWGIEGKDLSTEMSEMPVEKAVTNIVIFDIAATGKTSAEIVARLTENGILAIGFGNLIRMVTHLDVASDGIAATIELMKRIVK